MKCNKLMKEALEAISKEDREILNKMKYKKPKGYEPKPGIGIDFTNRLEVALNKISKELPNGNRASISVRYLKKKLKREGVSEAEIKLAGLFDNISEPIPNKQLKKYKAAGLSDEQIETITGKILANAKYKVNLGEIRKRARALGLRIDDITRSTNGNSISYDTTTYKEKGYGNTTYRIYGLYTNNQKWGKTTAYTHFSDRNEGLIGWVRLHVAEHEEFNNGNPVLIMDEFQSDWFQKLKPDGKETPFGYHKVKQFAIVKSLDRAIKEGLDTVIIPIDRVTEENMLAGSSKVSDIYRRLNSEILPKLRKQLSKKGLKIETKHLDKGKPTEHIEIKINTKSSTKGLPKVEKLYKDDGFVTAKGLNTLLNKYKATFNQLKDSDIKTPSVFHIKLKDDRASDLLDKYDIIDIDEEDLSYRGIILYSDEETTFKELLEEYPDLLKDIPELGNVKLIYNGLAEEYMVFKEYFPSEAYYNGTLNKEYVKSLSEKFDIPFYNFEEVLDKYRHSNGVLSIDGIKKLEEGYSTSFLELNDNIPIDKEYHLIMPENEAEALVLKYPKFFIVLDDDTIIFTPYSFTKNELFEEMPDLLDIAPSIDRIQLIVGKHGAAPKKFIHTAIDIIYGQKKVNVQAAKMFTNDLGISFYKNIDKEKYMDSIKIRWDLMGLLAALGLSDITAKEQEAK